MSHINTYSYLHDGWLFCVAEHTPLLRHVSDLQTGSSHVVPMKPPPAAHSHNGLFTIELHLPPFLQGDAKKEDTATLTGE